ncbi:protein DPCD-like [Harmonia axyridis]|uniref:protein DPCD-like n=1 Tax=Harmonia axyridis TaxID=115357 RepID=UPI001E276A45|nr:protein DPCD-like [Harmonia axyridis]XP_045460843.1 protein DPCD-like [Harmonia axyridis]XP_045460844.1 protein DPCD-like [Harmonia axyridis]
MKNWLDQLKNAKKHIWDDNSLRTVLYKFKDGNQLEEEYNLELNVVTRRAWKKTNQIGKDWIIELGEPEKEPFNSIASYIKENESQPYVHKRNTRKMIEWRIKNLPYSEETYLITCNEKDKSINVKTKNKKYYKNLRITELERLGLPSKQDNLSFKYDKQILIIRYIKPKELIEFDKALLEMVKELKPTSDLVDYNEDNSDLDEPPLKKMKIEEL